MSESYTIFDRSLVRARQKKRARANQDQLYLFREGAAQLAERAQDFKRVYRDVLALGPLIARDFFNTPPKNLISGPGTDEEDLGFSENSFDLVVSNLTLHWVNDLPGALIQINRALKPDGLVLAVMFGAGTLFELRQALLLAETEVTGGASPRVSPFAEIKDAGHLLQRAGFQMPVTDVEKIEVSFKTPYHLMGDLKSMGENNALLERKKTFTRRGVLDRAAEIYQETFGDREGRIPATFQFLHLKGFAPGPNQPKPLKPGSAKVDLGDIFGKKPKGS